MKNLQHFNLAASLIFTASLLMAAQTSNAEPAMCTMREYKGEMIAHCELPPVMISAARLTVHESNSTLGEQMITVELPEVVITAPAVKPSEEQSEVVETVTNPSLEEAIQVEESVATIMTEAHDQELKHRPLIPFVANKIYDAGVWFLKKMNDGLFFRS